MSIFDLNPMFFEDDVIVSITVKKGEKVLKNYLNLSKNPEKNPKATGIFICDEIKKLKCKLGGKEWKNQDGYCR